MKKTLTLVLIITALGTQANTNLKSVIPEVEMNERYRVTAYTQTGSLDGEKWIDLSIETSSGIIIGVYYNGRRVQMYDDYSGRNVHYVSVQGNYFYFKF